LKSCNKIFMIFCKFIETCSNSLKKLSFISVLSSIGAGTLRKMTSHQRPLSIVYDILSLTNSTLLAAGMLCTKEPAPDDHPISKETFYSPSRTPTKTDYILIFLSALL
jgi:hypothetical protein